jgi:glycosyltransferase involved in cell wall biosynthesis
MASGVPVVQPNIGGFPEIIEKTGGGVLYEPNTAHRLAEVISSLLINPSRIMALGQAAMMSVNRDYGARRVAELMAHVYQRLMTSVYHTKKRR